MTNRTNAAPSGVPVIQVGGTAIGTTAPRVNQTLSADITGIADTDGLTTPGWTYQWVRVDSGTDSDIPGETGSTYTVAAADVGKTLKVKVSFTDDTSNAHALESAETETVVAAAALPAISIAGPSAAIQETADAEFTLTRTGATAAALEVTVTVSESGGEVLAASEEGDRTVTFLAASATAMFTVNVDDDDVFEPDSTVTAAVKAVSGGGYTASATNGSASVTVQDEDPPATTVTLRVPSAAVAEADGTFEATITATTARDEAFRPGFTFGVALTARAGTAVGGSDYVAVSEALTFSQSDFTRGGAPGSEVWSAEQRFAVTLVDDADEEAAETFELVLERPANLSAAITVDGTVHAVTIARSDVVAPALEDPGGAVVNGATLVLTYDEALDGSAVSTPPATAYTLGGTSATVSGVSVSGRVVTLRLSAAVASSATVTLTYTVPSAVAGTSGPVRDLVGEPAGALTARAVTNRTNAAPSGVPVIQVGGAAIGTTAPRVNQTLSADVTGIADTDGLSSPGWSYQWVRVDSGTDSDIPGETGSTYTVAAADVGKKLKVRVGFTDDTSNAHALESAETVAVVAATNSPATGQPTIAGTLQVGETLTAGDGRYHGRQRPGERELALPVAPRRHGVGYVHGHLRCNAPDLRASGVGPGAVHPCACGVCGRRRERGDGDERGVGSGSGRGERGGVGPADDRGDVAGGGDADGGHERDHGPETAWRTCSSPTSGSGGSGRTGCSRTSWMRRLRCTRFRRRTRGSTSGCVWTSGTTTATRRRRPATPRARCWPRRTWRRRGSRR